MDTPRTPRDNLRTSPGLEDLEDELDAPLLPGRLAGGPLVGLGLEGSPLPAAEEGKR